MFGLFKPITPMVVGTYRVRWSVPLHHLWGGEGIDWIYKDFETLSEAEEFMLIGKTYELKFTVYELIPYTSNREREIVRY